MPGFRSTGAEHVKKEKSARKSSEGRGSFFSRKEKKQKEVVASPQPITEQTLDGAGDLAPLPHFKNNLQVTGSGSNGELREIFEQFINGGELHPLIEDRAVGAFEPQGLPGKVQVTIL